jgi:hypothetical protein
MVRSGAVAGLIDREMRCKTDAERSKERSGPAPRRTVSLGQHKEQVAAKPSLTYLSRKRSRACRFRPPSFDVIVEHRFSRSKPPGKPATNSNLQGDTTMRFMLIAHANKDSEAGVPPNPKLMAAIGKLAEDMAKAGVLVGMGGLAPTATGARLRLSGGKVTVTDGPFTETKEIIGGYAIVQVNSKEEAIALARRFWEIHAEVLGPSYEGSGEVRQLFGPPDDAPEGRKP